MISFLLCLAILIGGYFVYGKIVDNTFGPDDRETPAVRINDGVDYVVMPQWKLFLVQLLNIAGLGPIFGALQGALWGPVVFLWITFGTIFAGGVHDYFSGMMSERNDGGSIAEITGKYLGPVMQNVMRVFSVVLLIMVGTVFAVGPAGLIVTLCKNNGMSGVLTTTLFWLVIILVYYFIATFISIDAVIGKIYPIFGICLIIMAVGVIFGIFTNPAYTIPEIWEHFGSMHPSGTPIWSFMFITVACGAVSGFHSLIGSGTTSKQLDSEKDAKVIGYGAMIVESALAVIALIAIGVVFKETNIGGGEKFLLTAPPTIFAGGVATMVATTFGGVADFSNPVYDTTYTLLTLAVSVFALTSLDSGTRLARYMFAELFVPEGKTREELTGARKFFSNPFVSTLIMVVIGCGMGFMGLNQIWGVFGAANQLLAGIAMLAVAFWLGQVGKSNKMFFVPMVFMLAATGTSLTMTIIAKIKLIAGLVADKTAAWGDWFQMIWSVGLIVLAVILVVEGVQVLAKPKAKKA